MNEAFSPVTPPVLPVVAAVILREDCVLVCRRKPDKTAGGLWEFPGGKIERGESAADALVREIREELGVEILPVLELSTDDTLVGDRVIRLTCIVAYLTAEGPHRSTDHDCLEWAKLDDLRRFEWAGPDRPAVALLEQHYELANAQIRRRRAQSS